MTSDELACQELVEVLTDYLEHRMPDVDRERLDEHLDVCGPCREYLAQMRRTICALGCLTPETVPPTVQRELLRVFRAWKQSAI
jgi:predicted anti-sigma-YlaC factor YlaD